MTQFDDFDTKVTAEEYYRSEGYDTDTIDAFVERDMELRDESKRGGKYHGPSNEAGLTAREYWESYYEWQDEQSDLRNQW